jgi:hypothetical protein
MGKFNRIFSINQTTVQDVENIPKPASAKANWDSIQAPDFGRRLSVKTSLMSIGEHGQPPESVAAALCKHIRVRATGSA